VDIKRTAAWVSLSLGLVGLIAVVFAGEGMVIDDYADGLDPNWREKSFAGHNEYSVVRKDGRLVIQAVSHASASALMYEKEYDPKEYPVLEWSWKIERIISDGDARRKETDDFAARVYVVFPSWAFWKTTALNYIWANRLDKGKAVPNAYTDNAMMIALESGPEKAGQWVNERVNIREDYRRYFGKDPPEAGAVAVMTDTDNTGEEVMAWYGPIRILPERKDS